MSGMVVLSNRRLGPSAELLVSREVAGELLREVAAAAGPAAQARWEHELVSWLQRCAASGSAIIDVADIAWTPEHFERQRRFLVEAIQRAHAELAARPRAHPLVRDDRGAPAGVGVRSAAAGSGHLAR